MYLLAVKLKSGLCRNIEFSSAEQLLEYLSGHDRPRAGDVYFSNGAGIGRLDIPTWVVRADEEVRLMFARVHRRRAASKYMSAQGILFYDVLDVNVWGSEWEVTYNVPGLPGIRTYKMEAWNE